MHKIILLAVLLAGPAMADEYVTVESVDASPYVCTVDGVVQEGEHVATHKAAERVANLQLSNPDAVVQCGRQEVLEGELTVAGRALVDHAEEPAEHEEPTDPHDPEPPVEPPEIPDEGTYRGIPEPAGHIGYDPYAVYLVDQTAAGNQERISCTATAANPCFVDASALQRTGKLTVSGQYLIMQGGFIAGPTDTDGPALNAEGCSFCTFRGVEAFGSESNFNVGSDSAIALGSNAVWIGGRVHGFGDRRVEAEEQDYHGIKVCGDDVWILDAEIYDVSGDSVQVGDASRCAAERVYIGGGYFHHNRENAVDIKDSIGVVVSGVTMEGFRPTGSSSGVALVVHDDAFDARIFDNTVLDANFGMVSSGKSGHVFDGNKINAIRIGFQCRNTENITFTNNEVTALEPIDIQSGCEGIQ